MSKAALIISKKETNTSTSRNVADTGSLYASVVVFWVLLLWRTASLQTSLQFLLPVGFQIREYSCFWMFLSVTILSGYQM